MYTFGQLKKAVIHVLGGAPDSRVSCGMIINRAINHIMAAHPWSWAMVIASIDIQPGQTEYRLPSDFSEIISVEQANGFGRLHQVSAHDMLPPHGGSYVWSLSMSLMPGGGVEWEIMLSPAPSRAVPGGVVVYYRRLIPPFPIDDRITTNDEQLPPIPSGMAEVVLLCARACALDIEDSPEVAAGAWQQAGQALAQAVAVDVRRTPGIISRMNNTGLTTSRIPGLGYPSAGHAGEIILE